MNNCQRTVVSYNKYLRGLLIPEHGKKQLTMLLQSPAELQLALEQIQKFEKSITGGEVRLKCLTEIKLSIVDSKGMSS